MQTLFDKFEIPDRYTIGGQEYTVVKKDIVRDSDDDAVFGLHNPFEAKLSIAEGYPTPTGTHPLSKDQIMNSFFHELFHSFNFMTNNEQEEWIAQSFANFMCEFLKTASYDSGHAGKPYLGERPLEEYHYDTD